MKKSELKKIIKEELLKEIKSWKSKKYGFQPDTFPEGDGVTIWFNGGSGVHVKMDDKTSYEDRWNNEWEISKQINEYVGKELEKILDSIPKKFKRKIK